MNDVVAERQGFRAWSVLVFSRSAIFLVHGIEDITMGQQRALLLLGLGPCLLGCWSRWMCAVLELSLSRPPIAFASSL